MNQPDSLAFGPRLTRDKDYRNENGAQADRSITGLKATCLEDGGVSIAIGGAYAVSCFSLDRKQIATLTEFMVKYIRHDASVGDRNMDIYMEYLQGMRNADLSQHYGVSRSRISQIVKHYRQKGV